MARAFEAGENAAAAKPTDAVVLTNLSSAYLQQGNFNFNRAAEVLQQGLSVNSEMQETVRLEPSVAETHIELADLLAATGRPENAWKSTAAL